MSRCTNAWRPYWSHDDDVAAIAAVSWHQATREYFRESMAFDTGTAEGLSSSPVLVLVVLACCSCCHLTMNGGLHLAFGLAFVYMCVGLLLSPIEVSLCVRECLTCVRVRVCAHVCVLLTVCLTVLAYFEAFYLPHRGTSLDTTTALTLTVTYWRCCLSC